MAHQRKRSFFRNAVDAIVEARQRQADRYMRQALLMLDDETLRAYGYRPEQVRRAVVFRGF